MTFGDGTRNQAATLWTFNGVDSAGDPSFSAPVAITVRWEDVNELFIDETGAEARSEAMVFLGQDVGLGDYLFLGTSVLTDPTNVIGAKRIRSFQKTPSLDASEFERLAVL